MEKYRREGMADSFAMMQGLNRKIFDAGDVQILSEKRAINLVIDALHYTSPAIDLIDVEFFSGPPLSSARIATLAAELADTSPVRDKGLKQLFSSLSQIPSRIYEIPIRTKNEFLQNLRSIFQSALDHYTDDDPLKIVLEKSATAYINHAATVLRLP